MAIRVLRLIEYVYKDEKAMADDMTRWTTSQNHKHMTMRSATLLPEAVEWQDDHDA